ncbi:hypothetical protein KKJ05_12505 [Xenorhabdus bovienii]|nr:hypothetical protein [Xenorhabdus bovienii]
MDEKQLQALATNGFENNLIVNLQEKVQGYENALKEMQKIMNSLKTINLYHKSYQLIVL